MSRIAYCAACSMQEKRLKTKIPLEHTCGREENWIRDGRRWEEYPVGTKAKALMGGYWVKIECGRWQWPGGCSFPTPGNDATGEVCLPFIEIYNKIKEL